jgi:hypothetical protein
MTYRERTMRRYEAVSVVGIFNRKVVDSLDFLRRLTVNLPRTTEFCCENCGEWRNEGSAKPLNSWLL